MKAKYTKKQIMESIKHWKKVLENIDENDTVHDDQVTEDTKLKLEVPGTDGAHIEVKGGWDAVRFCVDMLTDALNHMKAKDPLNYKGVSLHVDNA